MDGRRTMADGAGSFITNILVPSEVAMVVVCVASAAAFRWIQRKVAHVT